MPTGYTADIKDGINFKKYAMNCARAFGACVMLRGEPGGGEKIPESFAPSDYHTKALDKARNELAELDAMTADEMERVAVKDYADAETNRVIRLREMADQKAAYQTMLAKVQNWVPPTDEHKGLHKFMAEQIIESIRHDCGGTYDDTPTVRVTGSQWMQRRRAALLHDLGYHLTEHAKEVERAEKRTAWVAALRASL